MLLVCIGCVNLFLVEDLVYVPLTECYTILDIKVFDKILNGKYYCMS